MNISTMDSTTKRLATEALHQQRLILEEKQRQKRMTSGGIRSSPFESISNPINYTQTNTSIPPLIDLSSSSSYNTSTSPSQSEYHSSINTPQSISTVSIQSHDTLTTTLSGNTSPSQSEDGDGGNIRTDRTIKVGISPRRQSDGIIAETMVALKEPDFEWIQKNVDEFVTNPAVEGVTYKCTITRDKNGMDKGIFPTYYLHLQNLTTGKNIFLMAARKRKKCKTANYLLSTDATCLQRTAKSFVGKVRCNALGTEFTIYDNGRNPKHTTESGEVRCELAAVVYDPNVLGFRGPRKMTIITPLVQGLPVLKIRPVVDKDTLIERYKNKRAGEIQIMRNKTPVWSEESQSFVLNFHGRVTQASVKNFQLVMDIENGSAAVTEEYVIMQFGRVSSEVFSMDFRYPLSTTQAFGIAMTSFHGKIACE